MWNMVMTENQMEDGDNDSIVDNEDFWFNYNPFEFDPFPEDAIRRGKRELRKLCYQLKSNKPDLTEVYASGFPFDDKGKLGKALLHNTNVTKLLSVDVPCKAAERTLYCISSARVLHYAVYVGLER
jgi:hypothetical protein